MSLDVYLNHKNRKSQSVSQNNVTFLVLLTLAIGIPRFLLDTN